MDVAIWLSFVGASYCLLLGLVTYRQNRLRRKTDKILVSILAIEGLRMAALAAIAIDLGGLWLVLPLLRLATGPLIYFYTLAMVGREVRIWGPRLLHFLPLLAITLLLVTVRVTGNWDLTRTDMVWLLAVVQGSQYLVYGVASLYVLYTTRVRQGANRSAMDVMNMRWLALLCAFIAAWGTALALRAVYVATTVPEDFMLGNAMLLTIIGTIIFCHVIALKGFQQSRLLENLIAEELANRAKSPAPEIEAPDDSADKYKSSSLSESDARDYYRLVCEVMEEEKLYLRPKLKLADLATESGILPQQLSQVINQSAGMTFYDFVNGYRIKEAIRLMEAEGEDSASILDVAMASGFNSPTTFYKYFRKFTGSAPKDYRRDLDVLAGADAALGESLDENRPV